MAGTATFLEETPQLQPDNSEAGSSPLTKATNFIVFFGGDFLGAIGRS